MADAARFLEHRSRRLALVALVAAVLLVAVYLAFVQTAIGQRFDDLAFDGRAAEDPEITRATNDLLHLVTRTTLALLTLGVVAVALLRRRPRLAVAAGAAITISVVTTEILKLHVLTRPDLDGVAGIQQNSFPSGHATIGMAVSLGLVLVAPHASRWVAAAVAVVVSTAFGVGVLATGWHRPSDTIGAYLVCVTAFAAVTALLIRLAAADVRDDMGELEERLDRRALTALGVVVTVAAAMALALTFQSDGLRTVEFAADYAAVAVVIIALGVSIVLAAAFLLRGISLDPPHVSPSRTTPATTRNANAAAAARPK